MKVQDISALIAVREFTFRSIDNILIKMSKEEVALLQRKLSLMDQKIIEGIIKLNLDSLQEKENLKNENSK